MRLYKIIVLALWTPIIAIVTYLSVKGWWKGGK